MHSLLFESEQLEILPCFDSRQTTHVSKNSCSMNRIYNVELHDLSGLSLL